MIKHPATYTNSFIPKFAELLIGCDNVLDIFGGVGKLAMIKEHGFTGKVIYNELEREWAETSPHNVDEWHIGDAANMCVGNQAIAANVLCMSSGTCTHFQISVNTYVPLLNTVLPAGVFY